MSARIACVSPLINSSKGSLLWLGQDIMIHVGCGNQAVLCASKRCSIDLQCMSCCLVYSPHRLLTSKIKMRVFPIMTHPDMEYAQQMATNL